jgi:hypothetical protein
VLVTGLDVAVVHVVTAVMTAVVASVEVAHVFPLVVVSLAMNGKPTVARKNPGNVPLAGT